MNIAELKAGRELDAIVAEKIMGWTDLSPVDPTIDWGTGVNGYRRNFGRDPETGKQDHLPFYSTDMNAAWKVVETVGKEKFKIEVTRRSDGKHFAMFVKVGNPSFDRLFEVFEYGETAPEAICKAALTAIGEMG